MSNIYRYSLEAEDCGIRVLWKCNSCDILLEKDPYHDMTNSAVCECGGVLKDIGESYDYPEKRYVYRRDV